MSEDCNFSKVKTYLKKTILLARKKLDFPQNSFFIHNKI